MTTETPHSDGSTDRRLRAWVGRNAGKFVLLGSLTLGLAGWWFLR